MCLAGTGTMVHWSKPLITLRYLSTTSSPFLTPNSYLGSWTPPTSPKEAQTRLAHLRRDYARKVKTVRKEYITEMEALRAQKARSDQAKREAMTRENQERRAEKDKVKLEKAAQRHLADQQFRETLVKERAEKLEYWKKNVEQVEEKKKKAKEGVRNRSSLWVDEAELESKILVAIVDRTQL